MSRKLRTLSGLRPGNGNSNVGRLRAQVEQLMAAKEAEAAAVPPIEVPKRPHPRMPPEHYASVFHNWSAKGAYRSLFIGSIGLAASVVGFGLIVNALFQLTFNP